MCRLRLSPSCARARASDNRRLPLAGLLRKCLGQRGPAGKARALRRGDRLDRHADAHRRQRLQARVTLDVRLPAVASPDTAADLVRAAHHVCPYSNATRGNIEVVLIGNGEVLEPTAGDVTGSAG
jgi:hypothetical protein